MKLLLSLGVLLCGPTALCFLPARPSAPPVPEKRQFDALVRDDFFQGFQGDEKALSHGMKLCDEALQSDPKNAEALVWHGCGLNYQAGVAFQKKDYANGSALWQKALQEMDNAVHLEPDNISVRIPRASCLIPSSRYVPDSMQRPLVERAREDFEKVYAIQKPTLSTLTLHSRGELLMGLSEIYERIGDKAKANATLKQVVETCPSTPYAQEAQTWLKADSSKTPHFHNCIGCHDTTKT